MLFIISSTSVYYITGRRCINKSTPGIAFRVHFSGIIVPVADEKVKNGVTQRNLARTPRNGYPDLFSDGKFHQRPLHLPSPNTVTN